MELSLRQQFPDLPELVLWKAELLFSGLRYTDELAQAVKEGAAPNFYPHRRRNADGKVDVIPIPYLFNLDSQAVARIRISGSSPLEVCASGDGFELHRAGRCLCSIEFVAKQNWHGFRTDDGLDPTQSGVSQMGDMLVVNVAPGCEYFTASDDTRKSLRCSFCAYGRFDKRSLTLGQTPGETLLDSSVPQRLEAVLSAAAQSPSVGHIYITGGSVLDPVWEVERFAPVVEAVRKGIGDDVRVTIGCGAVDPEGSQRLRDAGADSACYNLEVWDPATFEACCPGKAKYVGRQRWLDALQGAVEVFGRGNVGSAFVAGLEMRPPAPGMTGAEMIASIVEGATYLLDRGITPVYSPLWPVEGTAYGPDDGITAELYLQLEFELYRLRAERRFPVPAWLICPDCSYMLLEVDFDRAFGLTTGDTTC